MKGEINYFLRSFIISVGLCVPAGVCKLYSEQRAIRVKRVVDKKRL